MTLDTAFDFVHDGLERLCTAKRRPKIFGADVHGFELNPPLKESAVAKFEARYKVRLPADYRRFLCVLGNGGVGPYYGIFKLGEIDGPDGDEKWKENELLIGDLSEPFPHTAPWNDLTGEPELIDDDDAFERADEAFNGRYWNAAKLYPISIGKKPRVTFLEWYLDWLNEAVGKSPKSRSPT